MREDLRPFPQDPTACQAVTPFPTFPPGKPGVLAGARVDGQLVDVPPLSNHPGTNVQDVALDAGMAGARCSLERR